MAGCPRARLGGASGAGTGDQVIRGRLRARPGPPAGVFTLDFWDALRGFCRRAGLPEGALVDLVTTDLDGRRMLADLERGAIGQREFEGYAAKRLGVESDGLLARMAAELVPDDRLLDALARLRAAGVRIAVLSNSWGSDYVRRANSETGFVMLCGSTWR